MLINRPSSALTESFYREQEEKKSKNFSNKDVLKPLSGVKDGFPDNVDAEYEVPWDFGRIVVACKGSFDPVVHSANPWIGDLTIKYRS